MAEIKITKKKPVWPWVILVLIIIAAIAYYIISSDKVITQDDMPSVRSGEVLESANADGMGTKVVVYPTPLGRKMT